MILFASEPGETRQEHKPQNRVYDVLLHVTCTSGAGSAADAWADARRGHRRTPGSGRAHGATLCADPARARHPSTNEARPLWWLHPTRWLSATARADERGSAGVELWPAGGGPTSAGAGRARRHPRPQEGDACLAIGHAGP